MAYFGFDRGRAIRLLRSHLRLARREPTQLFPQCDRSAFAWTRSSDPAADKLHWSCSPAVNSVPDRCSDQLGPMSPSTFSCDESALVLTAEQRWDCRETASVLLTDRPSCCGQAVAKRLSILKILQPGRSSLLVAEYRRIGRQGADRGPSIRTVQSSGLAT
jgi:hypothetical protein